MQTKRNWGVAEHTVGMDLGDRKSAVCRLDAQGAVIERRTIATTGSALEEYFRDLPRARVVIEASTHSPWISRLLEGWGHEVIVANPSKVRGGKKLRRKNDRIDAEFLARQGRADPQLLGPIEHRGEEAQADLVLLATRDAMVKCRSLLVSHVRGVVKALGGRIPSCSTESFHHRAKEHLPPQLVNILQGTLEEIGSLSARIRAMDREVERLGEERYPEVRAMQQITGVGPVTSLCFALVIEDPARFGSRRAVGPYLGLVSGLDESSEGTLELRISKAGNAMCRKYLVQSAQYILGPFGPDCDLRRWGMGLIGASKSRKAKKRAVIAVARKLSVLMLRLWVTGETYHPLFNAEARKAA